MVVLRRLIKHPTVIMSLIILAGFLTVGVLAPFLPLRDPFTTNPTMRLFPLFTPGHVLGTDELGRDILSRLVWGTRLAFGVGLTSAFLSLVLGALLGLLSGMSTGITDHVIMRGIDVLMSFPYILLSIAIVAVLGPGLLNTMIAIAVMGVPTYARIVRSAVISLREEEFVVAAHALGASNTRITFRHMLPNLVSVLIIVTTLDMGTKITAAAGLSFLGLGIQPPAADWGVMLASGRSYFLLAPHVVIFPGLAIFLTVLALNFLGDSLQELLDPKLSRT